MASNIPTIRLLADSIPAEQKEHLHEVANLMLNIYQTLVDMRYLDPKALILGPHELKEDLLAAYKECGLDPSIIYLYSVMPYVDDVETNVRDFFQGGTFFNQMKHAEVQQGRDPCYIGPTDGFEDEDGQYMYPWYTPLSNCGNHSPMIIYDAREHRIWIIHQIDHCSTDPVFREDWYSDDEEEEEEEEDGSDDGYDSNLSDVNDDGNDGEAAADEDQHAEDDDGAGAESDHIDSEERDGTEADQSEDMEGDEDSEHTAELSEEERREAAAETNRNSLEAVMNRSAGSVLSDINQWYRELKELPGQGEYTRWLEPKILRPLYVKNGWPEAFDGDQFEVDMALAHCTESAQYDAEDVLRQIDCFVGWIELTEDAIERHKENIAQAKTVDEEWAARLELWKTEEKSRANARDLKNARDKAERTCTDGKCQRDEDLPLWLMEKVRVEAKWKQERVTNHEGQEMKKRYNNDLEKIRQAEARQRRAKHESQIYEKALQFARAEAERMRPGKTFQEATGIRSLGRRDTLTLIEQQKERLTNAEIYSQGILEFAATVPQDALQAKAAVDAEVEKSQKELKTIQESLTQSEKRLAEHGNDAE